MSTEHELKQIVKERFRDLKASYSIDTDKPYRQLLRYYALKALSLPSIINKFIDGRGWDEDQVFAVTGLDRKFLEELEEKQINRRKRNKVLKEYVLKKTSLVQLCKPIKSSTLEKNVSTLAKHMELGELEQQVLVLSVMIENEVGFSDILDELGELNTSKVKRLFTFLLDTSISDMHHVFSRDSKLASSGLLKLDADNRRSNQKLELLDGLNDKLMDNRFHLNDLLHEYFRPAKKTKLTLKNYTHLEKELDLLVPLISQAIEDQTPGTNILIYGIPGTGKTELVKTINKTLKTRLYSINTEDDDGDSIRGEKRLEYLKFAQKSLKKGRFLLLFDEMEDIFDESGVSLAEFFGGRSSRKGAGKGWMNQLLENNTIPTIWLSNDIHGMDSAYLRRFQLKIEMKPLPKNVRLKMIQSAYKGIKLNKLFKQQLAQSPHLTPAMLNSTAESARSILKHSSHQSGEALLTQLIENYSIHQGDPIVMKPEKKSKLEYNPDFINTSFPMKDLVQGLIENKSGRVCLYGVPGTGKTAFVNYLGEALNIPVIAKKGSDLQSKWVGETEQNLAAMFQEASRENSILFLDEADSFLRQRSSGSRSWEVSQVNELLTQMEQFEGVFFCSTNFLDIFDEASLRRFDLKIEFTPMNPEQRFAFFKSIVKQFSLPLTKGEQGPIQSQLATMDMLTPGDFNVVSRQNTFFSKPKSALDLLNQLQRENDMKVQRKNPRKIGF